LVILYVVKTADVVKAADVVGAAVVVNSKERLNYNR
jgi:hypothetical protein